MENYIGEVTIVTLFWIILSLLLSGYLEVDIDNPLQGFLFFIFTPLIAVVVIVLAIVAEILDFTTWVTKR